MRLCLQEFVGAALCKKAQETTNRQTRLNGGFLTGRQAVNNGGAGTGKWIHCLLIVDHQGDRPMVPGVRRAGAVGREKGRKRPVLIASKTTATAVAGGWHPPKVLGESKLKGPKTPPLKQVGVYQC